MILRSGPKPVVGRVRLVSVDSILWTNECNAIVVVFVAHSHGVWHFSCVSIASRNLVCDLLAIRINYDDSSCGRNHDAQCCNWCLCAMGNPAHQLAMSRVISGWSIIRVFSSA